jgi:hypothetical protein
MVADHPDSSGPPNTTGLLLSTHSADELSPLEQDILDEYGRLADNMKKVCERTLPGSNEVIDL